MPSRKRAKNHPVYQLKITLKGSKPPIWRRVQVANNTTLSKLHKIIQVAMGWWDSHLHQFIIHGENFGIPDPDFDFMEVTSERGTKLSGVISSEKDKFIYEYDFGDSWEHVILVEKILPPDPNISYPICLKGKRTCPPEDCGGIWGYNDFLEAIQDPDHPEHDDMLEWVGGEFDSEAFSLDEVNSRLKNII